MCDVFFNLASERACVPRAADVCLPVSLLGFPRAQATMEMLVGYDAYATVDFKGCAVYARLYMLSSSNAIVPDDLLAIGNQRAAPLPFAETQIWPPLRGAARGGGKGSGGSGGGRGGGHGGRRRQGAQRWVGREDDFFSADTLQGEDAASSQGDVAGDATDGSRDESEGADDDLSSRPEEESAVDALVSAQLQAR